MLNIENHQMAIDLLRKSLARNPNSAQACLDLGNALQTAGQLPEAIDCFRRLTSLRPDFAGGFNNLGNALQENGQNDLAIAACRHAIALQPRLAEAHNNLGNALKATKRLDEALASYRRALELQSNYSEAWYNLGVTLQAQAQLTDAQAAFRRAIALNPDFAQALCNLGSILTDIGRVEESIACFRRALQSNPALTEAHNNLGNALRDQGRLDDAIASYRRALEFKPDFAVAHSNLIFALNCHADDRAIFDESRRYQHQHAAPLAEFIRPPSNDRTPGRILRVGYVSPDFRQHSVAYFIEGLLAAHDPRHVEVFCYADLPTPDPASLRLQNLAHHWQNITGLDDHEVADAICHDRIDILVDLAGHTGHNRLLAFARKPAPIQITYLGYCNTTGLAAMDYRLTDSFADPPGAAEPLYTEQLLRLPDCFACYHPPQEAPPVSPPPSQASGAITFASLHMLSKLNDRVLEQWAKILSQVPNSRLMLVATGLDEPSCRRPFETFFAARGISPARLEFRARQALPDYLAMHHQIDIALDTWPYSGHTISCHALWMGVPVITLAGQSHRSRMVASVLTHAGLAEFIAQTPDQYAQLAVDLAHNTNRLATLRRTLRPQIANSPLTDTPRFARNLEIAYRQIWQKWWPPGATGPGATGPGATGSGATGPGATGPRSSRPRA